MEEGLGKLGTKFILFLVVKMDASKSKSLCASMGLMFSHVVKLMMLFHSRERWEKNSVWRWH